MKNKNKLLKWIFFAIFLLALIVGYFFWMKHKAKPAETNPKGADVTVITIAKQQVQLSTELPARVEAYRTSDVRPQVEGVIRKINFEQGSFVKKGQQLYQIDTRMYQTAFEGARTYWKAQKAKRERYAILLKQDAVSKQEFADVDAAATLAEAEFMRAQTNLAYSKVEAPISGYIGKSNITEGALVTTNQVDPLTTITQLDPLYVDMVQPSKDAIKLQNQKEIPVTLITENNSYQAVGRLKFSEVFVEENTDSVRLRAIFPNVEKKLLPGMFVTARIHLKPFEAITVPQRVTTRGQDGSLSVWIVDKDNLAKQRKIKAEQIVGDNWIVTDGLEEGDIVIFEGYLKIAEGAKVNPLTLEEAESRSLNLSKGVSAPNASQAPSSNTLRQAQRPEVQKPTIIETPPAVDVEIDHTVPESIIEFAKKISAKKKPKKKLPEKSMIMIEQNLPNAPQIMPMQVSPTHETAATLNANPELQNSATPSFTKPTPVNPIQANNPAVGAAPSSMTIPSVIPNPATSTQNNPGITNAPAVAVPIQPANLNSTTSPVNPIQSTPIHTNPAPTSPVTPITGGGK
jgi:membrane fusion protein (multidrug efflux system)